MPSHDEEREARQLALGAVFEADFGQHTAGQALERRFRDEQIAPAVAKKAHTTDAAVVAYRYTIDARIEQIAPPYPVVQLARIDHSLVRCAMAELLHFYTLSARDALSE